MTMETDNSIVTEDVRKLARRRRRKQNDVGYVFKDNGCWYVRYYTGEKTVRQDGKTLYKQACQRLGSVSQLTKDAAKGEAARILKPLTSPKGVTYSNLTIGQYVAETVSEWWKRSLKPSTLYGYDKIWRLNLKPVLEH